MILLRRVCKTSQPKSVTRSNRIPKSSWQHHPPNWFIDVFCGSRWENLISTEVSLLWDDLPIILSFFSEKIAQQLIKTFNIICQNWIALNYKSGLHGGDTSQVWVELPFVLYT